MPCDSLTTEWRADRPVGVGRWRRRPALARRLEQRQHDRIPPNVRPAAYALLLAIAATLDSGDAVHEVLEGASVETSKERNLELQRLSDAGLIRADFIRGERGQIVAVVVTALTAVGALTTGRELDRHGVLMPLEV